VEKNTDTMTPQQWFIGSVVILPSVVALLCIQWLLCRLFVLAINDANYPKIFFMARKIWGFYKEHTHKKQ